MEVFRDVTDKKAFRKNPYSFILICDGNTLQNYYYTLLINDILYYWYIYSPGFDQLEAS